MRIQKFEDVIAWQKAGLLTNELYDLFETNRDYSFKDQILRASVSVMNNIAEGFDRGTDKEFIYFLNVARGSSSEVRSMLYIAHDRNYLSKEKKEELTILTNDIGKIITGLKKSLTPKDKRPETIL